MHPRREVWLGVALVVFTPFVGRTATLHVPADYATIGAGLLASSAGDTVEVACGEYSEGTLVVPSGVVLRSATGNPDCVTLHAGAPYGCCIRLVGAGSSTQIEGFELVGGWGPGGGVYCLGSNPLIRSCRFRGNHTGTDGAGLAMGLGSAPHVVACEFVDNDVLQGGRGGAIWASESQPIFEDCVIRRNGARSGGGAFAMNSSMAFLRCTFEDNYTPQALGAHGTGGAVYGDQASWSFEACRFIGNFAGTLGGGLYCVGPASLTMDGCELRENSAYLGAGGMDLVAMGGDFTDCLFVRNEAITGRAGALVVSARSTVVGCTFFGNRSAQDGSSLVWSLPVMTMSRTIIAAGVGGTPVQCEPEDTAELTCCDIFGNDGGDWIACLAIQRGQSGNMSVDPEFCDPAAGDLTLYVTSPCAPGNSPENCGLIGALPVACGPVAVTPQTWARLKAQFR